MAKSLVLKHLNKKRNKIKRKTVSCRIKESKLTLGFFVVLLICVMGFAFMSGVNNAATKGYEVESYEKKIAELEREEQKMMIELADLKSIQAIDNEDNGLIAVDHNNIAYVASTSSAVALK